MHALWVVGLMLIVSASAFDYYEVLNVPRTATADEVKTAFRALSKIYHPDKNPDGAETFVKLTEAYETLSDAEERRHYDAHGKRKSTVSGSQQRQQQHHPGERGFSFFTFAEKHWGHQARFRQESKAKDTARFEAIKEAQGERQKAKLEKAEKKSHRWERWSKTFVN